MKAAAIMSRYRMTKDDQIEVVRLLLAAGVEHCLQEQEKVGSGNLQTIERTYGGLVH
ncbi:MAG TPA: hypothetical protein VN517_03710 [Terriglobales bacterium]|nr:hypothetical protein [Terriglobales bacterium]